MNGEECEMSVAESVHEEVIIPPERDGVLFRVCGGPRFRPRHFHTHDELEFNLTVSGSGEYLTDAGRLRLQPGGLIWLYPAQPHALHRLSDGFQMWVAVFRQSLVRDTCRDGRNRVLCGKEAPADGRFAQLNPQMVAELVAIITRLCEAVREAGGLDEFNAGLRYLLHRAWQLTRSRQSDAPCPDACDPAVFEVAMALHKNPALDSLRDLARGTGLSAEHLARLFQRQMGATMTDYRNEQRLRLFRELYGNGDRLSLTEAAYEAGFGSYAQCFRVCKQLWGESPSILKRPQG